MLEYRKKKKANKKKHNSNKAVFKYLLMTWLSNCITYHKPVNTNFDDHKSVCNCLEKFGLHPFVINRYVHICIVNPGVLMGQRNKQNFESTFVFSCHESF